MLAVALAALTACQIVFSSRAPAANLMAATENLAVTPACESQNPRLSLDIDENWWVLHAHRISTSDIPMKLPDDICLRRGQWIALSRKNSAVIWGRAHVLDLQKLPDAITARVQITPAHHDRELRPDCETPCEILWRRLPVGAPGVTLVDLRAPSVKPRGEVPGAVNIPWTGQVTEFDFQKLPAKPKAVVLFGESSEVTFPPLTDLVRELRRRDIEKIYWYYPGYRGLQNLARLFPGPESPSEFCGDLVLHESDHLRLQEPGEVTTLARTPPPHCRAGDALRLVRYERPADTAFVVGAGRILYQTSASLRIEVENYDPRETGWIAAVHAAAPLRIETTQQIPTREMRRLRPGEILRAQQNHDAKLAMSREKMFFLSSTGLEWRGDLELLARNLTANSPPVSILAERPRWPKPHPEGVIVVTPAWHEWLQKSRATVIRPAHVFWPGTGIERPRKLSDHWIETWIRRRALLPVGQAILVLGDGLGDQDDVQIIRELLRAGYSRVYWDPGTMRPPTWKIRFDPYESYR